MKNHFSNRENKIIKILARKKMTIEEVSEKLFDDKPFDYKIAISNSICRIIKKCEYHKLKFTFVKTRENKKLYIKRTNSGG